MNIDEFINKFIGCFDGIEPGKVLAETQFRDLPEWDSLTALTLLAMIDSDYDVTISATELRNCSKVFEIFYLIKAKKSN